jgi:hypothetical protein
LIYAICQECSIFGQDPDRVSQPSASLRSIQSFFLPTRRPDICLNRYALITSKSWFRRHCLNQDSHDLRIALIAWQRLDADHPYGVGKQDRDGERPCTITLYPSASPSPINGGRGVYEMAEMVMATKRSCLGGSFTPDHMQADGSRRVRFVIGRGCHAGGSGAHRLCKRSQLSL